MPCFPLKTINLDLSLFHLINKTKQSGVDAILFYMAKPLLNFEFESKWKDNKGKEKEYFPINTSLPQQ